jgi:hypothetical protein
MPNRRRTSRRRTSRNTGARRVTIRHGSISGPGFKATAYKGSDPAFRGRIAVERGSGMVEFPSVAQLPRILREEGIATSAAEQAFGRGRLKANGKDPIPKFGSAGRVKIGHFGDAGFVAGTRKGSLILFDLKGGEHGAAKVLWGVSEDPTGNLRNFVSNRKATLKSVIATAKSLNMPMQVVYDAFRHLMDAKMRKEILVSIHRGAGKTGMSIAGPDDDERDEGEEGEEGGYEGE